MNNEKELEVLSRLRVSLQGLNIMLEAIGTVEMPSANQIRERSRSGWRELREGNRG